MDEDAHENPGSESCSILPHYADILRRDFVAFNHRAFRALNTDTPYCGNWHLEVLAAKLEAVRTGRLRRLAIALPPRSLKSHTVSIAFVAFVLGHDPSRQIICASYAQDLSDKLARDCRALMTAPFYRALFATTLAPDRQAVADFATTRGGFRFSTSVGGVLTGRGADLIVIDDPLKADEAWSEARRNAVNEWFDASLVSRLNDKEKGAIIVVMQRLHENDLIGHVMETGGFELLSFAALAERDERYDVATPYGQRVFARRQEEALHPERESAATLARLKEQMGTAAFLAQYQQTPAARDGAMIKAKWFPRYAAHALPKGFDIKLLSCDTANKASELSDFSVLTLWGVTDFEFWLLDVVRKRLEYPDLKRTILALARDHKPDIVLIEDRASGTQLIQELKRERLNVEAATPTDDKRMRVWAQTAAMEQGKVHLPNDAPWLDDYLRELTGFPNLHYDDQVDSTTQALQWVATNFRKDGWLEIAARHTGRKASTMVRVGRG